MPTPETIGWIGASIFIKARPIRQFAWGLKSGPATRSARRCCRET
jgi:hypothetical protein